MTQESPRDKFFGFEVKLIVIEEAKFQKAPYMVNKIYGGGGVPWDGDVIEVSSEVHIYINGNKLPAPDNLLVPEAVSQAAHGILNG